MDIVNSSHVISCSANGEETALIWDNNMTSLWTMTLIANYSYSFHYMDCFKWLNRAMINTKTYLLNRKKLVSHPISVIHKQRTANQLRRDITTTNETNTLANQPTNQLHWYKTSLCSVIMQELWSVTTSGRQHEVYKV